MKRRVFTGKELSYLGNNYWRFSAKQLGERLGRERTVISNRLSRMGLQAGVKRGYVIIHGCLNTGAQVPGIDSIIRKARSQGAYYRADYPYAPHCVREDWMEQYLATRLQREANELIAEREGWWSAMDIALAVGQTVCTVSTALRLGYGPVGRAFADVPMIRGNRDRRLYEPTATRIIMTRLGQYHRRAA